MKDSKYIFLLWIFSTTLAYGQTTSAEDFGFRHLVFRYKTDPIDILIKSKKGEEYLRKPLFFFCQGSLPIPLILHRGNDAYGTFPFTPDSLTQTYHVVIISKPSIPLIADVTTLKPNFTFVDSTNNFPKGYINRNLLSYYAPRNIALLRWLQTLPWVSTKQLVVAGHSEGSTIAAKMASTFSNITHLIYSGGNPAGRILTMIEGNRSYETDTDSTRYGEDMLQHWSDISTKHHKKTIVYGDPDLATLEFSEPMLPFLEKLKIPVLVTYGTKDWSSPYNDMLRVNLLRKRKNNFTFKAYIGVEHNFFPLTKDNKPNYDIFNWDNVVSDWRIWLTSTTLR